MMKRIKTLFLCFSVIMGLLTARLFYIGVINNKKYTENVISQRTSTVKFKSPRGIIYDRNMIKITDSDMKLAVKDGIPYYVGTRSNRLLCHVIGYISPDGKGSGIEGAFDYVLSSDENSSISYLRDINNNMISKGYSIDIGDSYKGVSLTIDYHIQKIVEDSMDDNKIRGAVIVADCSSGEILAMASRPYYNPVNLESYLSGTEGELLNRSILQYNPGSVFKIIVTSAFLENHFGNNIVYECNGKTLIDDREFVCHKEDGHGLQTLEQAFVNSCNCAYYIIGETVGIDEIYKYASDYGIGNEILKINGIYEDKGNVPYSVYNKSQLANISIGQGDVMATPLQITDMMCTICNGGIRNQLTLVRGIVDNEGNCMEAEGTQIGRVISETTARRLMEMMNSGVLYGTGTEARLDKHTSGGKTGTAETGVVKDGEEVKQAWFAGYFPAEEPKYVCVVMVEDGISGGVSACPVFKQIGDNILN